MRYLFIDTETSTSKEVTLSRMTLRAYLARSRLLGFAYCFDEDEPTWVGEDGLADAYPLLAEAARDPGTTWVAHNAAFDIRVFRFLLGVPQPQHVLCTLELSCGAFPQHAGGYSLANLAETLHLGRPKGRLGVDPLPAYCCNDVWLCREIFRIAYPMLDEKEIAIAEMCNDIRELHLDIDAAKVQASFTAFGQVASDARTEALAILGEDSADAFGMDGDTVRSVKPHVVKKLLLENLGFEVQSISKKKINPERLRASPQASAVITATETANKALSQYRRVKTFIGREQVDIELGYYRATATGRFSSPTPGCKGINLHNLNKRQPLIAKAIRSIFRWPEGLCCVRADFANVEYRIEGLLTSCEHTARIFGADPTADPYLAFGNMATGRTFTKADPIRQVFKAAVLGLGYLMSGHRFAEELLKTVADPVNRVSLDDLKRVCADMKWHEYHLPSNMKGAITKLRCPAEFGIVAHYMRELFHEMHPEFGRLARWLEHTVARVSAAVDPERALADEYQHPAAPRRDLVDVLWLGDRYGNGTRSIAVRCGAWQHPTVVWRDLAMRQCLVFGQPGVALTAMHARKGYRPLTRNILIENVIQSAARNALCEGQLALRPEFPYQLTVHDELMLVVRQDVSEVRRARSELLRVLGPGNQLGWGWAVVINPKEINVSKSLYEVNQSAEWWATLDEDKLKELP